jgi:hypothetical protein
LYNQIVNTDQPKTDGRKIWFPAKRYGWGWGPPGCWQGWVFLRFWLAALIGSAFYFFRPGQQNPAAFFSFEAVLLVALFIVCLLKGEKPGWRRGGKQPRPPGVAGRAPFSISEPEF